MRARALGSMAWRDLAATRARSLVSGTGIAMGVAVLLVIAGLGLGARDVIVKEVVRELPVDMVEVIPKTVDLGLVKLRAGGIFGSVAFDDDLVRRLAQLPGIVQVYPKLEVRMPVGARGGAQIFGRGIYTDLFMTGLPDELVQPEVGAEFRDGPGPIPVVISSQLIEIFNTSVAPGLGVPAMTASTLVGFEFDLVVGRSIMLGSRGTKQQGVVRARIVGVSRHAMRIGISVPLASARRLLDEYAEGADRSYGSIVVQASHPRDVPEIARAVAALGLDVDDTAKRTSDVVSATTAIASLIGLLVLAMAAVNIAHAFFALLSERRRELAVLRAVGATRTDLLLVVLVQAAIVGAGGGLVGAVLARLVAFAIDRVGLTLVPDFPFKPETFFSMPLWLFVAAWVAAIAAACLGALWPAVRASRLPVARALS